MLLNGDIDSKRSERRDEEWKLEEKSQEMCFE